MAMQTATRPTQMKTIRSIPEYDKVDAHLTIRAVGNSIRWQKFFNNEKHFPNLKGTNDEDKIDWVPQFYNTLLGFFHLCFYLTISLRI